MRVDATDGVAALFSSPRASLGRFRCALRLLARVRPLQRYVQRRSSCKKKWWMTFFPRTLSWGMLPCSFIARREIGQGNAGIIVFSCVSVTDTKVREVYHHQYFIFFYLFTKYCRPCGPCRRGRVQHKYTYNAQFGIINKSGKDKNNSK